MSLTLESLKVIDRLEVGPVIVEPRRLVAPYRVLAGDTDTATRLIYRYEEAVFDPDDPAPFEKRPRAGNTERGRVARNLLP